jgi:hypothetical protein
MRTTRGIIALALMVVGLGVLTGGCVLVPVGPRVAYGPRYAAPVVPVPAPVVVIRPYRYW